MTGPPPGVWGYIRRTNGARQLGLGLFAVGVASLNLAPLEVQRRIVDDAIIGGDAALLAALGVTYAALALAHQGAKFALRMGQAWLSESAVAQARRNLTDFAAARPGGASVSVLGSEVDQLGGFVGGALSQAVQDAAVLIGVIGFMLLSAPEIAWVALLLFAPKLVLTPILQRRLNRLTAERLALMRAYGAQVGDGATAAAAEPAIQALYANRMRFHLWKNILKGAIALLGAAAPLSVMLIGGYLAINGEASAGVIVAFLSGFQRMAGPIRDLLSFYREAAQAQVRYRMIAGWI